MSAPRRGMIQGALTAALGCTKNTPFADVGDAVTAVNEPILDAAPRTRRILAVMEEVFAGLTLRPERMARAAAEGFGSATELADVIVRESGMSFRMAHNVVALVVRDALAAGLPADAIRSADLDRAATTLFGKPLGVAEAAVAQALDPAANIRARTVLGGPAPAEMAGCWRHGGRRWRAMPRRSRPSPAASPRRATAAWRAPAPWPADGPDCDRAGHGLSSLYARAVAAVRNRRVHHVDPSCRLPRRRAGPRGGPGPGRRGGARLASAAAMAGSASLSARRPIGDRGPIATYYGGYWAPPAYYPPPRLYAPPPPVYYAPPIVGYPQPTYIVPPQGYAPPAQAPTAKRR